MAIYKAQDQTLTYYGVDLENKCFSHDIPRGFDLCHIRIE